MHSFQQFLLEYDRAKTIASLGQKFKSRLESDHARRYRGLETPESVVEYLEKGDPTPNHQYVQWLVKAYINGSKLEDLVSRGYDALVKFEKLKKKKLLPVGQTDIGKLDDLEELEDLVGSIELPTEELKDKGQSEEIWDDDEVRIIVPHNEAAACYYGQGTKWCTAAANNNMFDYYSGEGDLMIFLPKHPKYTGEKYQGHFQDNQWMDEQDKEVSLSVIKRRFPSVDFSKIRVLVGHAITDDKSDQTATKETILRRLKAGTISLMRVFRYTREVLQTRWPEAEPYILKDPKWAYYYAHDIIKGRWPEAEPYILKSPEWIREYINDIIQGRWKEAEPVIMKNPEWAYYYALNIIKGRWPEAEPHIMEDSRYAVMYAKNIIKSRWPEAEPYIIKNVGIACEYALYVIKGRWPEAEPAIIKNIRWMRFYANEVVKGHWPEAEEAWSKNEKEW